MTITLGPTVEWYNKNPLLITNGLVMSIDIGNSACYPGSGTTLFDLSGNGNDMTFNSGSPYSPDNGGYISFVQGLQLEAATLSGFNTGNTPHTIDSFFYIDSMAVDIMWIAQLGDSSFGANRWLFNNISTYPTTPTDLGPTGGNRLHPYITNGNWYHLVTTHDGSTFKAYINGVNVGSTSTSFNFTFSGGTAFSMATFAAEPFFGKISNVRIYNRALQGYEILSNFNYFRGRFGL